MLLKEFIQLAPRPRLLRHDHHDPADAADAVRLRHQHDAAPPADRGAAAGAERSRPLDPRRRSRTPNISRSPDCRATRPSSTELLASGDGAVRHRDPGEFRARGAPRRQAGDAGRGRRHRSGRRRHGARRARPSRADRARRTTAPCPAAPPCRSRSAPTPRYNPAGVDPAQHRAGPGRHHPHHDHADLHRAVGDARDRARHHGKPAVDADHAGRDHARQDRALCHRRLRAGGADHRHRRRAVRRAGGRQPAAARGADRRCSSPPICRSATPSRPWRRTSCRRCRCR